MADNNDPRPGDGVVNLLVKLLDRVGAGISATVSSVIVSSGSVALTSQVGAANLVSSQAATATGTATSKLAARNTRRSVVIRNVDASITIYIGGDATVDSTHGLPLKAGESVTLDTKAAIFAQAASATPSLAFLETYD